MDINDIIIQFSSKRIAGLGTATLNPVSVFVQGFVETLW